MEWSFAPNRCMGARLGSLVEGNHDVSGRANSLGLISKLHTGNL